MKKGYLFFLLLCLVALLLTGCGEERLATGGATIEKKVVYTTFFPLYDFTKKIGGEKIEVVNMVPAGVEPHDWEPSPQLIGSLSEAEMLISNGLGMETWLDKVSSSISASVVVVNASTGIEPLKGAKDHGYGKEKQDDYAAEEEKYDEMPDPHVWLDPLLALQQARNIATALSSLDPANATYYFNNLAVFQEQAEALDQAFQDGLSGLARREIIVTHLAFAYLAKRYNLEQVSISGLSPYIEPSPAQMKDIQDFGRNFLLPH
ncbi:zinc transport system substrate-binding protein [Candidatus Hakubella thermalkaliphila]|uniref:Zinc transport system substrate-binding protein n=1 Tax=Candidatus Hakubella thermalkaliphila TaxID=2754717 RepID=A0A6V8PKH4_9ACTN|nr:zinc transport system substrate-binding protein [Candidatus Hakubella thermalkaliphila]